MLLLLAGGLWTASRIHVDTPREVEGLTIWDYDAVRANDPGADDNVGGQVHLVLLRNLIDDPVGMKHFRIPVDERAFL